MDPPFKEIRTASDLESLKRGPGVVRMVMNGCHWCNESQPEFNKACRSAPLKPGAFMAQLEHELLEPFQRMFKMGDFPGYPHTVVMVNGKILSPVQGRDAPSILSAAAKHGVVSPAGSPSTPAPKTRSKRRGKKRSKTAAPKKRKSRRNAAK